MLVKSEDELMLLNRNELMLLDRNCKSQTMKDAKKKRKKELRTLNQKDSCPHEMVLVPFIYLQIMSEHKLKHSRAK